MGGCVIFKLKKQINILIIDDEESIRKLLTTYLNHWNFNTISAENGTIGIKMAKEMKPSLILLDLDMPGLHGLNVCEILKNDKRTKHIPIILLTGSSKVSDIDNGYLQGANEYVVKPIVWEKLKLKISVVLRI